MIMMIVSLMTITAMSEVLVMVIVFVLIAKLMVVVAANDGSDRGGIDG